MKKLSNRSVSVSLSGIGLLITLSAFEKCDNNPTELKFIHLDYPDGEIMHAVEKALNILVGDWERVFVSNERLNVRAMVKEDDYELFDLIYLAEEPTQAFISHYVLEYKNGVLAHWRNHDKVLREMVSLRMRLDGVSNA